MSTTPPPIDIVTVSVALATAVFGSAAGQYVGPYAVIFLGAVLGSAWSASKRTPGTRIGTLTYMAILVGIALLITVPLAEAAGAWLGRDSRWLLGPVAALVGGVGERWGDVGTWAAGLARGVIERRAGARPDQPPGDQP